MRILLTAFAVCFYLITYSQSQFWTESSMQLDWMNNKRLLSMHPIGEKGLLLLYNDSGDKSYKLQLFSTSFQKEKELPLHLDKSWKGLGLFANEDSTEFSFVFASKSSWEIKTFNLLKRTLSEESYTMPDKDFTAREAIRFKDKLVISGLLHWRPRIIVLDLISGIQELQELPNMKDNGAVISMTNDSGNRRLAIFYRKTKSKKRGEMNLVFMDANGACSSPFFLQKESRYFLLSGRVTWVGEGSFVLAGTYGLSRFSTAAAGFFFSRWENYRQQSMTYHSFSQLEDHYAHLPEAQLKIVEVVKQRPDAVDFVQNTVIFHPVYTTDSGFRLIAEVYYRKEDYVTTYVKNLKGETEEKHEKVFLGYEYIDALVLDLDPQGNKINDYCLAMNLGRLPRKALSQLWVQYSQQGEMQMVYAQSDRLLLHEINESGLKTTIIDGVRNETDIPGRITNAARLIHWYGNSYLVYGYQMSIAYEEGLFRDYEWVSGNFLFARKLTFNP